MGRNKKDIKAEMTSSFMSNANIAAIYGFNIGDVFENTFSLVSLENFLFEIFAFAMFLHEQIFDTHVKEVETALFNQKSGSLAWYRTMAFNFQYGYDLVTDKDYYDNTGVSEEDIEASKIIKYCAVVEPQDESRIQIKIAGDNNGKLTKFGDADQVEAVQAYFQEIKYPGRIEIINYDADKLYLNIQIKRDALVLNENGMHKINANFPVQEAIEEFMKELDFNGELLISFLIAKIKGVTGVLDATLLSAESSWYVPTLNGFGERESIFISKVAVSGYFEVQNYDNITYVV